jgi:hypothetical protein
MFLWFATESATWIRGGLAAFFFGKAALPPFQLAGVLRGEAKLTSFARGYRALAVGYIAAGCVIGVGALWRRSFFGFLVAYGAFSWVGSGSG